MLSEYLKEGKISFNVYNTELIDELTQELLVIKYKNLDKDNKLGVISKDDMKKMLGRSPDLADAIAMRMYPEAKFQKATGRYSLAII
jgi:hypothetical protein